MPVLEGVQLQPWFTSSVTDKGLKLIREQKIEGFHCIRNVVGAVVDGKALVTLQFEKSEKLHQGFIIRTRYCGLCRTRADKEGCEHLAALAILSLIVPKGGTKAIPIPLAFSGSNWEKIGLFLYEWLSKCKYKVRSSREEGCSSWKIMLEQGFVRVGLPEAWRHQGEILLSGGREEPTGQKLDKVFKLLEKQLLALTMSVTERALAETGNSSIGWKRDTSFWTWLARMLFCFHEGVLPEIHHVPEDTFSFSLSLEPKRGQGSLHAVIPGMKIWDLVRKVGFPEKEAAILPKARECFRVFFNTENALQIEPCLHLADGRILVRQDLSGSRFAGGYYLEGEGFLPVIRLSAEGIVKKSHQRESLPLMGFLQSEADKDSPFIVEPNDIQAFLDVNRKALAHPDNIVDPDLQVLKVHALPERLVIDSYEEHDDWCYLSCRYGFGNIYITINDIRTARKKKLTCLPGKQWLQIDGTPLSWLYDLADDRFVADGSGRVRLSYKEMLALTAVVPDVAISLKDKPLQKRLSALLDSACWTDDSYPGQVPEHLRSYQVGGLAWLNQLYRLGIGGLLADDMGLGKTHQALALLQRAQRDGLKIVVCPASVVLNWAEKIERFYKGLNYIIYYGPQRDLEASGKNGLILTTYGVVRQDLRQLRQLSFDLIILDEIQHLKNRNTATHKSIVNLNGRVKIGLTGTPIENSLQDLHSIFDICLPGLLGSEREFDLFYNQPITEAGDTGAKERLSRLVRPFILRRTRRQVLTELPEIIEDDRICELSDDQIGLYRQIIKDRETDVKGFMDETARIPTMNILAIITRLKRVCNHPCLVQGSDDPEEYKSGKWDLFVELAAELLAAEMKFVVFSQYTGMLELIEKYLQTMGIGFCSLKGDMPAGKRQKMIAEFNENPACNVFCASLLAGGVGIDLTGAQAVIHYDRWWNPAKEEQATARVHRMGQKHVVQVFRLITRGTLEEKIHTLITKKRELAGAMIQEDEVGIIKQMDRRQLAELFHLSPSLYS